MKYRLYTMNRILDLSWLYVGDIEFKSQEEANKYCETSSNSAYIYKVVPE